MAGVGGVGFGVASASRAFPYFLASISTTICALRSRFAAFQARWFFMTSLALELTRPCPVSTHILAIVTTVGSSSIPGWSGSYGIGDFFALRGFREGFGVAPVSVSSSGSGVDPRFRSGSEAEALRETLFLGTLLSPAGCWERRALLEGGLAGLDSISIADAGRFFNGVDGE